MTIPHHLHITVPTLHTMARIAEIFEEEARALGEDGESFYWQEMATACRQQCEGRRFGHWIHRPAFAEIRWDVVERAANGPSPYPRLSDEEAREVSRQLTEEGKSARYIAPRVEVAQRTINRWRREEKRAQQ